MSHAFALLSGVCVAVAALKTSVTESGWGFLFLAAILLAVIGGLAANEEETKRRR